MRLLMHICCAPCSIMCIDTLRAEEIEPTGFFYNPNIHPVTEYRMRKNTLTRYAGDVHLKLIVENEYGLRRFVANTIGNVNDRCEYCYTVRLAETAKYAKENGYDAFTSTLFISPYQKHELLRRTAEKVQEEYGVEFLYRDFRPRFREGQEKAKELGLYRQKYCGCIFSEEERFSNDLRKARKKFFRCQV